MLRDLFGNTFGLVAIPPEWRTPTVVALARVIAAERAFDLVLVLGDALEDAGCDSGDILTYCRGPGVLMSGCWLVDLLLGQT